MKSPLRQLREARMMTQVDYAKFCGVHWRTICTIEHEQNAPRVTTRRRILKAEGIPYQEHTRIFGPLPVFGPKVADGGTVASPALDTLAEGRGGTTSAERFTCTRGHPRCALERMGACEGGSR